MESGKRGKERLIGHILLGIAVLWIAIYFIGMLLIRLDYIPN